MPSLPIIHHDVFDASWSMSDTEDGDQGGGGGGGSRLGNWSSLIGIVTAIVGNILIALALNVQRYAHIQLHRRRAEARWRAREALKRVQDHPRTSYGTAESPVVPDARVDEHEDGTAEETHPLAQSFHSTDTTWTENESADSKVTSTYLKSPAWWAGQVLMTIGEMGNFLAYGFAPASIVSPLGVFALIANCVIAPIFFGEHFRKRDFWGVVIAVAGAVIVVLSANQEETKLDPHDVWDAITATAFEVYLGVTIFLILLLMWASPRYGHRTILIDLGLVGLFGGYTVLTTKGVSSMLSSTLFKVFTSPVMYGLAFILLGTAVMQVRYVNKALQRFDSTQVIPIQFVLFTLSVIIGSAVLYRDFERTTSTQAIKFVGGCLFTFFGVFLITSGRPPQDDEDQLSEDEDIEETINLRQREAAELSGQPREGSRPGGHQPNSVASSRRSSLGSRISFASTSIQHLPPNRDPRASVSRTSLSTPAEQSPLLSNPWARSTDNLMSGVGLPHALSNDSVVTIHSAPSVALSEPAQVSHSHTAPILDAPSLEQPVTPPRHSVSDSRPRSRHLNNPFISPSPLSSTVSAVVLDALGGRDGSVSRRPSTRRMKSSLLASLGIPRDGDSSDVLAAGPLLPTHNRDVGAPPGDGAEDDEDEGRDQPDDGEPKKSLRRRAHSVSNTLEGFFGRKKRRRRNNTVTSHSRSAGSSTPGSVRGDDE